MNDKIRQQRTWKKTARELGRERFLSPPPRSNVSGSFSLYFERFYSQLSINMNKDIHVTAAECKFILICFKKMRFLTFKYSSPGENDGDKSEFPLFSNQLERF